MTYLIMKLLHIIFVVLFLGNIILGIFWKTYGDKTKDKKIIAHTLKGMQRSGRLFGTPGILGILIFGFAAQGIGGYSITTPWILWSIILFIFSGFAFGAKVGKLHKKMLLLAESDSSDGSDQFNFDEYKKLSSKWTTWGLIALTALSIAVVFMVLKIPY